MNNEFSVHFKKENLTITINDGTREIYEIDLQRCNDSARLLDYIFQIHNKTWCTPKLIKDLLNTLEKACQDVFDNYVQGVFCSMGHDYKVDWKQAKSISKEA